MRKVFGNRIRNYSCKLHQPDARLNPLVKKILGLTCINNAYNFIHGSPQKLLSDIMSDLTYIHIGRYTLVDLTTS